MRQPTYPRRQLMSRHNVTGRPAMPGPHAKLGSREAPLKTWVPGPTWAGDLGARTPSGSSGHAHMCFPSLPNAVRLPDVPAACHARVRTGCGGTAGERQKPKMLVISTRSGAAKSQATLTFFRRSSR